MGPPPRQNETAKASRQEMTKSGKSIMTGAGKSELGKLNKSTNFFHYTALNTRSNSMRARNRHGPPNHWGNSLRRSRSAVGSLMTDHPLSHLARPPQPEFGNFGDSLPMTSHGDNSRVRLFYRTSGESSMRLVEPRNEKPGSMPTTMWLSPQGNNPAKPWLEFARDPPRGCRIQSTGDLSRGHDW